ncbi:MAG: type II toxin-antitoxin system prevent-host-death family antitoxin [Candidatus Eremiobacteraeota bacterium]|nr:type II toxin-antitoxin system prevent-host-death family antitoxin [Candidatus Eremiobacteraeota bacterium]
MRKMTAKELKNKTGEAMRIVRDGGKVLITVRGKPQAMMIPASSEASEGEKTIRDYKEAMEDIENTLSQTHPRFDSWQEAVEWSRRTV